MPDNRAEDKKTTYTAAEAAGLQATIQRQQDEIESLKKLKEDRKPVASQSQIWLYASGLWSKTPIQILPWFYGRVRSLVSFFLRI